MPNIPPLDRLSFWLGFLAASLFWWVLSRIYHAVPGFIKTLRERSLERSEQVTSGLSVHVRQVTHQQVQANHLAANLFSLDEIAVAPRLLAPPAWLINPDHLQSPSSIASQAVPYLPHWNELATQLPVDHLEPYQALLQNARIAIIGEPGSGKTFCLSYLASQLARQAISDAGVSDWVPIYLHILDLKLGSGDEVKPVDDIVKMVASKLPLQQRGRTAGFINETANTNNLVLLVDGLDELPPAILEQAVTWLNTLLSQLPGLRIMVAASSVYLDGLSALHFQSLAMAGWSENDRASAITIWTQAWNTHISPEVTKFSKQPDINPLLVGNWLSGESGIHSPLEWTLRIWSVLAGDVRGLTMQEALEAYLLRLAGKTLPGEALDQLACDMIANQQPGISFQALERSFNKYAPSAPGDETEETTGHRAGPDGKKPKRISSGAKAINNLLDSGLLREYDSGVISFSHIVITGFLSSYSISHEIPTALMRTWDTARMSTRYMAAQGRLTTWITGQAETVTAPFFDPIVESARWLSDAPASAEWRPVVMRKLAGFFQQESLSPSERATIASAFVATNDPSIPLLLQQFLTHKSPVVRQLSALACGAYRSSKLQDSLLGLFNAPNTEVRLAACLAIGANAGAATRKIMLEVLQHADEEMRQAAAEAIASDPVNGLTDLENAANSDDLLTRRAAAFGLARLNTTQAQLILEKMSLEDAQWVVRNAASALIEEINQIPPTVPTPLSAPDRSPWLITFAGKQGQGIPAGDPAVELMIRALQNGDLSERIFAMSHLKYYSDPGIIGILYHILYQEYGPLQAAAYNTLLYMKTGGADMPSPVQYGF